MPDLIGILLIVAGWWNWARFPITLSRFGNDGVGLPRFGNDGVGLPRFGNDGGVLPRFGGVGGVCCRVSGMRGWGWRVWGVTVLRSVLAAGREGFVVAVGGCGVDEG